MSSKNVSQIFKISFQTGDINDHLVFHGAFFSRYVLLKSSFSDKKKKKSAVKSETHLRREAIGN